MKKLFYFVGGVIFVTLISATTVSVMTVKPQLPKSTVFIRTNGTEEVNSWLKKGYIIKIVAKGDEWSSCTVVLEKY